MDVISPPELPLQIQVARYSGGGARSDLGPAWFIRPAPALHLGPRPLLAERECVRSVSGGFPSVLLFILGSGQGT